MSIVKVDIAIRKDLSGNVVLHHRAPSDRRPSPAPWCQCAHHVRGESGFPKAPDAGHVHFVPRVRLHVAVLQGLSLFRRHMTGIVIDTGPSLLEAFDWQF